MADETISIENISQYISTLGRLEQRHVAQWFYRGHADCSFKLVPSLYRLDIEGSFAKWSDVELYMMAAFRCEASPFLEDIPNDDLEWLALAQHYGLPTRLLDWTVNPLIALYFAIESHPECDADVWCLGFPSTNNCLAESTYFARRLTLHKSEIFYFPRHMSSRVTNQSGCFTVHETEVPLEEANIFGLDYFVRIRIMASRKASLLNELYTLGIHRGFIYPGLEGIAKRLQFEVATKHYRHTNIESPFSQER